MYSSYFYVGYNYVHLPLYFFYGDYSMKKLPIGIQTFSELIREDYVYVDKTKYIYSLITTGKYYFIARPRRFGKSLFISTLAEIFAGNRELFVGLAIDSLPYDWKKYPVISLSFSDFDCTTPENLNESIKRYLQRIAKLYQLSLEIVNTPGAMLQDLVYMLAQQAPVVLLIDEYDYAILKHIHNPSMADEIREVVKNFYAVIKGLDQYFKFVLLTGVSKFSKTSIFSGLNNLNDISLSSSSNSLLGYTYNELEIYFEQYLISFARSLGCSMQQLLEKITLWYDGYQFTKESSDTQIYNPFSVLLCLKNNDFANYWFETGTPTFLINLLKLKNYPLQNFEMIKATAEELGQFEVDDIDLKALMFQTGYITIKGYNHESSNYILGYPNRETINSLGGLVVKSMSGLSRSDLNDVVMTLLDVFEKCDFRQLFNVLTQLFSSVPYTIHIGEEKYFQTIFYVVLKMIGADIIVEQPTNSGRLDAIIQTKATCFIVEFKINSTAAKAIQQIEDKKYYQPYLSLGKKIVLVGITFDTIIKNVGEIDYKELKVRI